MRRIFMAVLGVVALAAEMQAASAQESFFNKRFCAEGGGSRGSGVPDCSFNTWEQCLASARGLGRYCTENPFWRADRPEPKTPGRGRRGRDR